MGTPTLLILSHPKLSGCYSSISPESFVSWKLCYSGNICTVAHVYDEIIIAWSPTVLNISINTLNGCSASCGRMKGGCTQAFLVVATLIPLPC